MFCVVFAAAAISLASAPTSAAPATAPTPATVLREIVYKFGFDRKIERSVEQFGSPDINVGQAGGYSGKMTVDVTQVGDDGSIRVTAQTSFHDVANVKKPFQADIVIHPDGSLVVIDGTYDDTMETLLPYLATKYFADHQLQQGANWKVISPPTDSVQSTTMYDVTDVSGDTATISSHGTMKGGTLTGANSVETKLVYKATLLVPLSLDIVVIHSGTDMSNGTTTPQQAQTHYHFDRVSDSRDP